MGTLYECLREARLEKFYPAFRANGITRSEALINLGMPEFCALGITAAEDKRRLIELVNIIKSVHNSGLNDSPSPHRRNNIARQAVSSPQYVSDTSTGHIGETSSENRSRLRPKSRATPQNEVSTPSAQRSEATRDFQDRAPNFSVASYMDMLQYMSESSESDESDSHLDQEVGLPIAQANRSVSSPSTVRSSSVRGPVERVKHSKAKGYNYGVHNAVSTPSKSRTLRSSSQRQTGDERIKVCVRKRPLTRREQRAKEEDIVTVESTNSLNVNEPKLAVDLKAYTLQHEFVFDEVFHESCTNEDVYIRSTRPLISCIFSGGTATCFAYGQTGAGKTHTMLGDADNPGLYLLAGHDIFSILQSGKYGQDLHVWVSFFEIYCGQLFDLLNRRNRLHAREDGSKQVCIAGLTETEATSVTSLIQISDYGNSVRSKGATGVNPDSSRSHAVLQLDIRDSQDVKKGKMSFIDLAGSERASDVTDTDRQTRLEGAEINQSLLALKECIRSIDQDSRHTPFRQSKLTHILKDSFVGNSKTCMIANISPTQTACENTLNTLRYADRVKELKRDSVRSSSVGHAMNLLMNIPPTAPSVFHPSNILYSSTPARSQTSSRMNLGSELQLDPSETPIRGHNMPRRHTGKESSRYRQATTQESNAIQVPPGTSTRSSSLATAASQGASAPPPPDASPSESDQTDTDSCNVTHPPRTAAVSGRPFPVVKSTDTEFDFPTSDFNNIDEINDLNRTDTLAKSETVQKDFPEVKPDEYGISGAAAAENTAPQSIATSAKRAPFLKPVVYKSTDRGSDTAYSASTPTGYGATQILSTSQMTSPKVSQHPLSFKKNTPEPLTSSDESVDDEDLFAEGNPLPSKPQKFNDLTASSSSKEIVTTTKPKSTTKERGKSVMQPLPAASTDLTQFTQRPSLKSSKEIGNKDLSPKPNVVIPQMGEDSGPVEKKLVVSSRAKSPSTRARSPVTKVTNTQSGLAPSVQVMDNQPEKSAQPQSRQLPMPKQYRKSPTVQDQNSAAFSPSFQRLENISPHPPSSSSEGVSRSPQGLKYSDGVESRRRRRASNSPIGEVSDDSTDSIRASLSDQGQGSYRMSGVSRGMRKERSDPLLALDMQRKKQTLPDPDKFSRMLTRSNTPKAGLPQSVVGWKAVHSKSPKHKDSHVDQCEGYAEYHSEPSSLAAETDIPENELSHEHLSDNNTYLSGSQREKGRGAKDFSTREIRKQLPQVPVAIGKVDGKSQQLCNPSNSGNDVPNAQLATEESRKVSNVIFTEKLTSGAVFSPIHPQPVTSSSTHAVTESTTSSSSVLQPTPVTASSIATNSGLSGQMSQEEYIMAENEVRMHLVSAHEDQLASITSLCKHEMRLLLNAKKVTGKRGFDDYLRRVSDILQQKVTTISALQEQISQYRSSISQSIATVSSVSVSDAGSQATHNNI